MDDLESPQNIETLVAVPLVEALRIIEIIHEEDQLTSWKKVEGRVRLRNAISKRLESIRAGKA